MTWRSRFITLGSAGALVIGLGQAAPATAGTPGAASAAPGIPGERHTVTLLTGDVVQVEGQPGGRQVAQVVPGAGRESIRFRQDEVDGKLSVIPSDAMPYLQSNRLDKALFNVTDLIAQGYADEQSGSLPLIARYSDRISVAAVPSLAATEPGPELPSLHGRAVREEKRRAGEFWKAFGGPQIMAGGVERISLDRKVRASLDRSVPQIGAPQAWAAGFDGTGTTVAVLDTGYDATHPDLAGKVVGSANFTPSPDTSDKFGHGTHVAATIAGTGAAAGGTRKGVAPGAKLIVGKVLDDTGSGEFSWILQGMEWAAASGAKVVNLSLGGGPTDGTDDLSVGLNEISARTGTLFVVAAGNDGEEGASTVGTPGSADAALTVGAVDRQEALAPFSSRGPRVGDLAVKPDITAPGVGIVAARAAGTSMGTPVDQYYTAASGTSMATPHVAGAAAILAQRYPQWTGQQLKDGLASTAKAANGLSVFEQGGGRVDVAAAAAHTGVYATGTLNLGPLNDTSGPIRKTVTYTNTTSASASLPLQLDLRRPDGGTAGDAVRPDKSTVDVPAGGSATVTITVDSARLVRGNYTGRLVAGGVHTTLGLVKEAPKHKLTVKGIGRDGKGTMYGMTLRGEDDRFDAVGDIFGSYTFEVGEGAYYIHGSTHDGLAPDEETTHVILPEFEVTKDMTVVLDARKAVPVEIQTPRPAVQNGILSYFTHREFGSRRITDYGMDFDGTRRVYVTPTERVKKGTLEFGTRWQMTAPMLTSTVLPSFDLQAELFYYGSSPVFSGVRWLRVVPVTDYRRVDVRGKIALVAPDENSYDVEKAAADAAKAGAAMVVITSPAGWSTYTKWRPQGDRLPIPTALITRDQGKRLAERAARVWTSLLLCGMPVSPYLYDVEQVTKDRVPDRVVHRVTDRNSATVITGYRKTGAAEWAKEQRFSWRPWETYAVNQYQRFMPTGRVREEVVTADDTIWQHRVKHYYSWDEMNPLNGGMVDAPRTYQPGRESTENWFAPVVRPAIPKGLQSSRSGDGMSLRVPEFVDAEATHYAFTEGEIDSTPDQEVARLYQDGRLLKEAPVAWGAFPVSPDPATYRLDLSVSRTTPNWQFGTHTDTSWTFRSQRPAAGQDQLLPLLQLDYGVPTDLANKAPAGRRTAIDLTARHQDGLAGPKVERMTASVSYDDGRTWTNLRLVNQGQGRFRAVVDHPRLDRTNGFVALRVRAVDAGGNSVEQTVLRAYGLA
ncbi:S8 family peptidase [Actinocrispum wychmicini]|uniref:Subtilisin family serine protease n=1 Tax=Actinocrispum wychmicini TaxID=1213861 RepID=A0A4R2IQ65_9PSEU|nr:S8 family serine peptidase [Actinocrispum wychmicini]TCO47393.1 subtilisin family serine protease [Actinocrispum wychmicini]